MKTASRMPWLGAFAFLGMLALMAGCAGTRTGGITNREMKRRMMQLETRDSASEQLLPQERELLTLWRARPDQTAPVVLTIFSVVGGTVLLPLALFLASADCYSGLILPNCHTHDDVLGALSITAFALGVVSSITGVIWLSVIGPERRGIEDRIRLLMEGEEQDSEPETYLLPWLVPDGRGGAAGGIGIGLRWGGWRL